MFAPYLLIAKVALVVLLLGGAAFGVHTYNTHQQDIGYAKAVSEYSQKLIAAQESAQRETAALNQKLQEANNAANRRNKQIDAAHAAAQSASDGLRSAVDSLGNSVPGATAAALANAVTSTSSLLVTCSERYSGVAEKGSRHASDVETLLNSWPDYAKMNGKP